MYIMSIKTITDYSKTYCYDCDEPTHTINTKREYSDELEVMVVKGNCEVCNTVKFDYGAYRHKDETRYCFRCKEITHSIERKRKYWEEENIYIYICKCEICNTIKIDKSKHLYKDKTFYCYICKNFTESINKKKEYWKKGDMYIIKCNCKVCNTFRIDKCESIFI